MSLDVAQGSKQIVSVRSHSTLLLFRRHGPRPHRMPTLVLNLSAVLYRKSHGPKRYACVFADQEVPEVSTDCLEKSALTVLLRYEDFSVV